MDETGSNVPVFPESQWIFSAVDSSWMRLDWFDGYHPSWILVLVLVTVAVYVAWYYLLVVNKPKVVGGGTSLREHILTHCPILSQYYYPTFWASNYHFTTIGRATLQKCPGVTYSRYVHVHEFMSACLPERSRRISCWVLLPVSAITLLQKSSFCYENMSSHQAHSIWACFSVSSRLIIINFTSSRNGREIMYISKY